MNNIRSFSRYGRPVWAPATSVAEDAPTLDTKEEDGVVYVRVYTSFVTDFNYTLPDSLNY